jgi:signal transduction histidine kinase
MKQNRRFPLNLKILISLVIAFTLTQVSATFLLDYIASTQFNQLVQSKGNSITRHFAQYNQYYALIESKEQIKSSMKLELDEPDVVCIAMTTKSNSKAYFLSLGNQTHPYCKRPPTKPQQTRSTELLFTAPIIAEVKSELSLFGKPAPAKPKRIQAGTVYLVISLKRLNKQRAALFTKFHILSLFFGVLLCLGLYWLLLRMFRPVTTLLEGMEAVDLDSLEQAHPLHINSNDELETLGNAFNAMLIRLQDSTSARLHAEAASHAKSAFLANMSHELRTPLNAIIGYAEILEEDLLDQEQDQSSIEDVNKIHTAGRHLLTLISDILDISKIEAGNMELHLETFAVQPLLEEVCETVAPLSEKNKNDFQIQFAHDIENIHTDITRLRQILFNVLSNAFKFTKDGTISFESSGFQADGRPWFQFVVTDTGIGMTEEQIEQVFQPFIQADTSTTRRYGGTGLGLSIVRELCLLMGGSIALESQPDQGTTCTIQLPALTQRRQQP